MPEDMQRSFKNFISPKATCREGFVTHYILSHKAKEYSPTGQLPKLNLKT
jgi:hypothetical protein